MSILGYSRLDCGCRQQYFIKPIIIFCRNFAVPVASEVLLPRLFCCIAPWKIVRFNFQSAVQDLALSNRLNGSLKRGKSDGTEFIGLRNLNGTEIPKCVIKKRYIFGFCHTISIKITLFRYMLKLIDYFYQTVDAYFVVILFSQYV